MAPWSPPKIGKDVPVLEIPAEPSGEPGLYNRAHYTTWHALAYVTDDFTFAPVPSYTEYLPIYAPPANLPERLPRRERLEAFVEKNLHVIRDMTVMPDLPYTVYDTEAGENRPAESIAIFDGHSGEDDAFFQCVGDGGSPYLTVPAKALKNPEVFPHMGFGLSKEAVLAALEDTVLYLEEIFGTEIYFNFGTVTPVAALSDGSMLNILSLTVNYNTSYDGFKEMINYLASDSRITSVQTASMEYDAASDTAIGSLTLSCYIMDSELLEYQSPTVTTPEVGKDIIFN
jgi:hypothetical protein